MTVKLSQAAQDVVLITLQAEKMTFEPAVVEVPKGGIFSGGFCVVADDAAVAGSCILKATLAAKDPSQSNNVGPTELIVTGCTLAVTKPAVAETGTCPSQSRW